MTTLDWLIVVILNVPIVIYALIRSRKTQTSRDWFLAGRTLPWWIIGLSMYATVIDSSDLVVDAGGAYQFGVSMFVVNWVGIVGGWILMAHVVALPMYRAGMYTNAEYLEARFGVAARIISVVVQVQFRTMVLAIMTKSIFLSLAIVLGLESGVAWLMVLAIALIATFYTMAGGLKAVAVTDAAQSVVMFAASLVIFLVVSNHVGGWSGVQQRLAQSVTGNATDLLHVGSDRIDLVERAVPIERAAPIDHFGTELGDSKVVGESADESLATATAHRTPGWLVCMSLVIAGMAYSIVNHTQSMRMFGARSEWDFKMSVVLASAVLMVVTYFNLSLGVMGRALYPVVAEIPVSESLQTVDAIFPVLVRDLAASGLKGIIVAGVIAASFSTYDSIGSTLSALLTRDIYARLIAPGREDHHYLTLGRWLTPVILFGSLVYLPWLDRGMFGFYLEMVGAFVTPLLTIYLMGAMTRVPRQAGAVGLIAGVGYGIWTLVAQWLAARSGVLLLPEALMSPMACAPASVLVTTVAMMATWIVKWKEPVGKLAFEAAVAQVVTERAEPSVSESTTGERPIPLLLGLALLSVGFYLSFVLFW